MDLFSSFAVNIASSIVFDSYKKIVELDTAKQIKIVFNKTLNTLIKNSIIREIERKSFEDFLKRYTSNPVELNKEDTKRYNVFVEIFEQIVSSHDKAFHFYSEIKAKKRFEATINTIKADKSAEVELLQGKIKDLKELRDYDNNLIIRLNNQIIKSENDKVRIIKQIDEIAKASIIVDEKLYNKTLDLVYVNKFDEALELLNDKILEEDENELEEKRKREDKKRKKEDFELAQRRILKARLFIIKSEFKIAEVHFEKAIKIDNSPNNIFEYAKFLYDLKYLQRSYLKYEKALTIYRELAKVNSKVYLKDVATTLNNMAIIQNERNEISQALKKHEEALQIRRELAKENLKTFSHDVAMTLTNLAVLQKGLHNFPEALAKYEEALQIYRTLAKENPRDYLQYVALEYNNLAILHKDQNEFSSALGECKESLLIYRYLAEGNPKTFLPYVAGTLENLGNLQKDINNFPEALNNYKESLQIYRNFAKENPRTYLPNVAKTLNSLGILHKDINNFSEAINNYEESLQIRRSLAKEDPEAYLYSVAITLTNFANLQKIKNEFPDALNKYEEALKIYEFFAKKNPMRYEIDYARSLMMGVDLFNQKISNLSIAKNILFKYKNVPSAIKLLEFIEGIEKRK